MNETTEGSAKISNSSNPKKRGAASKKMPVFYNPSMKFNRDVSIALLNSLGIKKMRIALPMAASGVRAIRFLKELKKGIIERIFINDRNPLAVKSIKKNLESNNLKDGENIVISCKDAGNFILDEKGFDYIDIDPFGSPNDFLDSSAKRISRKGILAVTATDTAPLAGAYPKTCLRKYWANPSNDYLMHEYGLRILIRKIQLIGAQYEKAFEPVFSYSKEHYFRIFFRCEKSRKKCDEIISNHKTIGKYGPMWCGRLWDSKIAEKIYSYFEGEKENKDFLRNIMEESIVADVQSEPGFFDIHKICSEKKLVASKTDEIINKITGSGELASRTHFSYKGIRTNIKKEKIAEILAELSRKYIK